MQQPAIGILGGSFNPPHEGHRAVVLHAMRRLALARMRVLVTPQNPLKDAESYAPLEKRIAMTNEVMRGLPNVRVAPEAELGPVYAVDSIRRLLMREPGRPFVYILGADSFAQLHRWHRWREIVSMVPIAVISRPGYRMEALNSPAARTYRQGRVPERDAPALPLKGAPAWTYISGLSQPESSTTIRQNQDPSSNGVRSAT